MGTLGMIMKINAIGTKELRYNKIMEENKCLKDTN